MQCILVSHHDAVGKATVVWEPARLKTEFVQYSRNGGAWKYTVIHYLLFERDDESRAFLNI